MSLTDLIKDLKSLEEEGIEEVTYGHVGYLVRSVSVIQLAAPQGAEPRKIANIS
jgi:hypothetical protein